MKRPHPLLLLAILAPLLLAGFALWRSDGAVVWLQGIMAYCL